MNQHRQFIIAAFQQIHELVEMQDLATQPNKQLELANAHDAAMKAIANSQPIATFVFGMLIQMLQFTIKFFPGISSEVKQQLTNATIEMEHTIRTTVFGQPSSVSAMAVKRIGLPSDES